jgi:hypothetical protein
VPHLRPSPDRVRGTRVDLAHRDGGDPARDPLFLGQEGGRSRGREPEKGSDHDTSFLRDPICYVRILGASNSGNRETESSRSNQKPERVPDDAERIGRFLLTKRQMGGMKKGRVGPLLE